MQSSNFKTAYPPIGVYEHYKSTPEDPKLYQVLAIAQHTETDEKFVVYIPLYTVPEHTGLRVRVRPLEMFVETVSINGKTVPRFHYVGTEL